MFRTLERYEDRSLGLPYAIVLHGGVEEEIDDDTGERIGISISDTENLVAAVAIARALHPLQLAGREVRFIRGVCGMSAKKFAEALSLDAATFSRWENDKQSVGEWADRQVRMAAIILLRDRATGLSADPTAIIGLRIQPRQNSEWPHIEMKHTHVANTGHDGESWDMKRAA